MTDRIAILLVAGCLAPASAWAQEEAVATIPPNLVIANYNSTSVGPYGGLEGAAYAARIGDPSAAWFNPAGLAKEISAQVSGSAGVYQRTLVAPRALPNRGGSIQQLPNFVGFTFVPSERVTVGAAILSTNAWTQITDSEAFSSATTGERRFAYSADSEFDQRVAAISAGYKRSDTLRVGGGFAFSIMDLRLVQSASDRVADPASLRSLLVSARAAASAWQLRTQGGLQYDKGAWRLGGAIRTPGLTFHRSGSVIADGVLANDPGSLGASLFDADAEMEYHLPWEFQGGAAFVSPRVELEVDVQAYTSVGAYALLASEQPVLLYSDAGPNAPPLVTTRPFQGMTAASDGVVNVAAGGHLRPWKDRDLRVHAGVGINQSPVASEDTIFSRVDLTTWSLGASGTFGRLQFAAGLNWQVGDADDVTLRNLLDGQQIQTPVDVRVVGFIYSLAYQF